LLGGIVVAVADLRWSREVALRTPYFIAGAGFVVLLAAAIPRLTTAKLEAARASVPGASPAPSR
jgi:hypothetical protein